jgi:glycosyltransferase involved in cell wall biosynthesis
VSERHQVTVLQLLLSLTVGGAEIMAAQIARGLSGSFRLIFACLTEKGLIGDRLSEEGYPIEVLCKRPGLDHQAIRRLRRVVRENRVDLIHAHQYGPFLYAALSRLPFGFGQPPIVLTEHGRADPDPPRPGHFVANRLLLRRRDRVFGVGACVARALIDKEGFQAARVGVIYNGIDLAALEGCQRYRDDVRNELGLGADDVLVIQVARLSQEKNHLAALRALERVIPERPDVRLVIVGDGPEAGAIREEVRRRGLEPYVRLTGMRNDVPRLLGAADVGLLTSTTEGIPLTVAEAMAAGLPVVSTRVGGLPEMLENGSTGFLAPSRDDAALAAHLIRLAADPELRRRLGEAGRARAYADFSEHTMIDKYNCCYHEILEMPANDPAWSPVSRTDSCVG